MAYRDFLNETPYESPVLGDLPRTLQALQFTQQQKLLKQRQSVDAAKDVTTYIATNKIPWAVTGINELAGEATKARLNEIYHGGLTPSQQTKAMLDEGPKLNARANAITDQVGELHKEIAENEKDQYYISKGDIQKANNVVVDNGEKFGPKKLDTYEQRVLDAKKSIYNVEDVLDNFAGQKHASDFVKAHGDKTNANKFEGQNGVKSGTERSGVFFLPNGMPGISDEVRQEYFNSHPMVQPYYTHLAMNDIQGDIEKALADKHGSLLKLQQSLISDAPVGSREWKADALHAIINNPVIDPIDQRPVNERMRDKADQTLKSYEKQTSKIDVSLKDTSSGSQWGVKNPDIATAEGFDSKEFSGPARTITNTKSAVNPYLTYSSAAPVRMDLATKEVNTNGLSQQFKLKSTKWVPVDAKGIPIPIQAANTDELIEKIKNLPYGTVANAKIAFEGDSLNGDVLDLAYTKRNELDAQYAIDQDPKTKATLDKLTETMENLRLGKDYNTEFLNQLLHVKVNKHELIPVDPGDENTRFVQSQTGMDVYSDKAQTPDMIRVRNAIQQKIRDDQQPVKEIKQIVEDVNKMPAKKGGKQKQADEVEQDGNIFKLDSATGQYKFSRKK